MRTTVNGVYQAIKPLAGMGGMLLPALLLTIRLVAVHFYARAYVEPPIESSSDCQDPNAQPGSRAEMSIAIRPS
jgi:hypothetical protein